MKKMITAAMLLLLLQIGLSLFFHVGRKGVDTGGPDSLFISFAPDAVHSIEITDGEGKNVLLTKEKDKWIVPAHFSAPVDNDKVQELLDKLAGMKQGLVVATSVEAAKRFKVAPESFENHVLLRGVDQALADFYVGTSPAFRQVYARRAESNAIVTTPLSGFELESGVDKWLDTSLAMQRDDDLVGLIFDTFTLKKEADGWQLEGRQGEEQINRLEVDALVAKARGLIVQDVLDPKEVSGLFAGKPLFHFTAVRKDDKQVEYLFAQGPGDFYVLKLSDRDLYLKVHTLPVEALRKVTREKLLEPAQPEEPSVEQPASLPKGE
ncbi:DUF4340 domain-containing protein [Desulfocastanea catecholica]